MSPWDQRFDETDAEYRLFRAWLGPPGEARSMPSDLALAAVKEWASRAAAFDQTSAVPDDPTECVGQGLRNIAQLFAIETAKHLREAQMSPECTTKLGQLVRVVEGFARVAEVLEPARGPLEIREGTDPALLEAVFKDYEKGLR